MKVIDTHVTRRCDYLDPALVWTGVKNSGRGVSLSKFGASPSFVPILLYTTHGWFSCAGYDQLTRAKSVHMKVRTVSPHL